MVLSGRSTDVQIRSEPGILPCFGTRALGNSTVERLWDGYAIQVSLVIQGDMSASKGPVAMGTTMSCWRRYVSLYIFAGLSKLNPFAVKVSQFSMKLPHSLFQRSFEYGGVVSIRCKESSYSKYSGLHHVATTGVTREARRLGSASRNKVSIKKDEGGTGGAST
jgi:hypothetical protein